MPTIIAVDCSLSMSRVLNLQDAQSHSSKGKVSQKQLAQQLCRNLLHYLSTHLKLEYTALFTFSSTCELVCGFTRDHELLQKSLSLAEVKDKACLDPLLHNIEELVLKEYGFMVPCHIIIITDGRLHWSAEVKTVNSANNSTTMSSNLPLQFSSSIHFLSVVPEKELKKARRDEIMNSVIEANDGRGTVSTLELSECDNDTDIGVENLVKNFTSKHLKVFTGTLQCGRLKSEIVLFPCPEPQQVYSDSDVREFWDINKDLHVVGFLKISDVKSPPALSRHLILPIENDQVTLNDENLLPDLGNHPSFLAALHGSLKVENKVALVCVGKDWYALVGSWTDTKKKSNLMLSLFKPGTGSIPWIGTIDQLGPLEGAPAPSSDKKVSHFTPTSETKSYAQNLVVWTRPTGLQTDVQKLLRSAKKLPEKTQVFYKDLNRLRKAALAFGFYDLLDGVAAILERECTMLPGTSHPEAALQLSHAAQELKTLKGYDSSISPLKTDFKYHSRS